MGKYFTVIVIEKSSQEKAFIKKVFHLKARR